MPVHREHLLLHLERLQQAFGRDQTLALPLASAAAAAEPAPATPWATPRAGGATAPRRAASLAASPARSLAASPAARPTATPARQAPPAAPAPSAAEPSAGPAASGIEGQLAALRTEVLDCRKCKLCEQRKNAVFGEGSPTARVMFIGEAPGANEDRTGRPFVGAAGQLLDRIISNAMGFERSEVFIANVNKCRPPNNREPQPDEVASCLPYLREQVALIEPEVIVCLGRVAAQNLLGRKESATRLRGLELDYDGTPVVVTWHPAYLLREPARKRETWEDIKRVNRLLDRPEVPPAQG